MRNAGKAETMKEEGEKFTVETKRLLLTSLNEMIKKQQLKRKALNDRKYFLFLTFLAPSELFLFRVKNFFFELHGKPAVHCPSILSTK